MTGVGGMFGEVAGALQRETVCKPESKGGQRPIAESKANVAEALSPHPVHQQLIDFGKHIYDELGRRRLILGCE